VCAVQARASAAVASASSSCAVAARLCRLAFVGRVAVVGRGESVGTGNPWRIVALVRADQVPMGISRQRTRRRPIGESGSGSAGLRAARAADATVVQGATSHETDDDRGAHAPYIATP